MTNSNYMDVEDLEVYKKLIMLPDTWHLKPDLQIPVIRNELLP